MVILSVVNLVLVVGIVVLWWVLLLLLVAHADLWLLSNIDSFDLGHLFVEGWWSEFAGSVEFLVDGEAHQGGFDSGVEESDEEFSGDETRDHDDDEWNPDIAEFFAVLGSVFHDEVAGSSVQSDDGEDSDENEHGSKGVGEVEFDEMLKTHDESVPSTLAVRITRNGHVGIGHGVQVLDKAFDAAHAALKEASNANDNSIISVVLLSCINEGINDNSQNSDESVDEGSECN